MGTGVSEAGMGQGNSSLGAGVSNGMGHGDSSQQTSVQDVVGQGGQF